MILRLPSGAEHHPGAGKHGHRARRGGRARPL